MPVSKPEDMHGAFKEAFNSGNADSVLALYEPTAVIVGQSGPVKGTEAIREALQGFLALKGKMTLESRYCVQSGDIALTSCKWQLRGSGPDGKPVEMQGTTAEVVRRQPDGRWLYIVDHPFGAD